MRRVKVGGQGGKMTLDQGGKVVYKSRLRSGWENDSRSEWESGIFESRLRSEIRVGK